MWFLGNEGYEYSNPGMDKKVIFDNWSSPNSRTTDGSESFISIEILSEISDSMYIRVKFNDGIIDEEIEIINLSDEPVQYLGNAVENNIGFIFYGKGDSIYRHSHGSGAINIDEYIPDQDPIILTCNTTLFDTLFITKNQYAWIDTLDGQFHEDYIAPRGYIDHPDNAHFFLASSDSSLSFGANLRNATLSSKSNIT